MLAEYLWAPVRRSAAKLAVDVQQIVYFVSGGKKPKSLFTAMAKPEKVGTRVQIVGEGDYSTDIAKFDKNGKISNEDFVILTTTDFHLDDYDSDKKTMEMFFRQIKDNKPDLVVLTGDIILGDYQQIDAIKFARAMEKIGVYWTAVFGNHETREEKGLYKWMLLKSFSVYPHCLCKFGPKELFGYGNHTVNIFGKDGLRQTLFMFDSGRNVNDEYKAQYNLPADFDSYDFLKKEQIDFYKNEIDRLEKKYGKFGSMMYMHIALKEFEEVFNLQEDGSYAPSGKAELLYGEQYESVGCAKYNSGMFDAILEKGSTKAVFAGHDHVNDWCAKYKGIYLVYSQHAGYSPYHMGTNFDRPEEKWMQGVTLTTIHPDNSFDIRQELNSKYLPGKENK